MRLVVTQTSMKNNLEWLDPTEIRINETNDKFQQIIQWKELKRWPKTMENSVDRNLYTFMYIEQWSMAQGREGKSVFGKPLGKKNEKYFSFYFYDCIFNVSIRSTSSCILFSPNAVTISNSSSWFLNISTFDLSIFQWLSTHIGKQNGWYHIIPKRFCLFLFYFLYSRWIYRSTRLRSDVERNYI